MLQKAKSSRRTPGGGDKAWASEAAVEGVKRLRQEVTALLRSTLASLRQEDTETLTTLLLKLQEKVCFLISHCLLCQNHLAIFSMRYEGFPLVLLCTIKNLFSYE